MSWRARMRRWEGAGVLLGMLDVIDNLRGRAPREVRGDALRLWGLYA